MSDQDNQLVDSSISETAGPHDEPARDEEQALSHMATTRRRGKGGSIELNFSEEPLSEGTPVIVFQHVRKTAGTSLRHTLRASLEGRHVYADTPETTRGLAAWHRAYYEAMSAEDKQTLRYIGGHTAGYFIPVIERPVRAITMVREPVDQVLSRYFFMRERDWTLSDVIADPDLRDKLTFFNAQSRSLLAPHFDVSEIPDSAEDPAAKDWKQWLLHILKEHYMLGVQDRFPASLAMFQAEFQLGYRSERRLRVNSDRPQDAQFPEDVLDDLRRLSWLDALLYDRAVSELDRYYADKPPEAQDPAHAESPRRKERKERHDSDRAASGSTVDVRAEIAALGAELASTQASLREELASIREELKEMSLRVKSLERKHRQERDEKRVARTGAEDEDTTPDAEPPAADGEESVTPPEEPRAADAEDLLSRTRTSRKPRKAGPDVGKSWRRTKGRAKAMFDRSDEAER